jgi:hypothetical protein
MYRRNAEKKVKIGAYSRFPVVVILPLLGILADTRKLSIKSYSIFFASCHPPSEPMAPSLELCPCPKCKGALVSHKTVLRHAAAIPRFPTFDEWIAAAPERLDTGKVSDGSTCSSEDDLEYDGMDGIEDEQVNQDVCRDCHVQYMAINLLLNLQYP